MATVSPEIGLETERRIAWLTLAFGYSAAVIVGLLGHHSWSFGLFIGTGLAWFNFGWLRRGLDALVAASVAQSEAAKPRVPIGTYFRALFRYALIVLIVYANFKFLRVPLASMVVGMCSLAAAAIAASVYELFRPGG